MGARGSALLAVAIIMAGPAVSQTPPPGCGDTVTVQRGDTLSSIAERCDVPERSVMRLNPRIEGSRDLRVEMQLRARGDGQSEAGNALGQLGSLARGAVSTLSDTLSDFATGLGSSARELLDKNPDLRQRLEGFKQKLRNSGADTVHGSLSVSPTEAAVGGSLNISAQGLPPDTPVVIGASRPQAAYEVLQNARTSSDGSLQMIIRIPDWAADTPRLAIVVAAENGDWSIRSQPIRVTGSKP
ncbi:LysM peptidoglycan-binding domain-containing protein [Microvirga sp. M2]|uniref:LysM peptidoglycan-binding domain-containing protein n=1 Tax=Microvirga sp. M2 TaxID=3073270 RepID=UPI0039C37E96